MQAGCGVGKIAAAVDCSSPLERSDVAEELSAIVRVVRVVEEALGKGANTRAKVLRYNQVSRPKQHGSDIWGGLKLRLSWLRTVVIDQPPLHQHCRASMYERRAGKQNASRQGSRPQKVVQEGK
jgi:hypothetical protein